MAKYICALDIGTAKVCAILGDLSQGTIIGAASSAGRGISQGAVVNIDDLTDVITGVITKLEEKTKLRIKDVYVNISGVHIESKNVKGKVVISEQGGGITAYDINKAINLAKNISLPLEKRIIHTIIQDYTLDGQGGITNPINLYGQELEVNLHIITASRQQIEKITDSISCAGLNIKELLPSAIASGLSVLTEEEKSSGAILIDIGGGVIDLAVFKGGKVQFAETFSFTGLNLDKLLRSTKEVLVNSGYASRAIVPFAVITGGYTSLHALGERMDKIEEILGVSARIGAPHNHHPNALELDSPAYATSLGLIQYGFAREKEQKTALTSFCSIFTKLASWAKKILSTYF